MLEMKDVVKTFGDFRALDGLTLTEELRRAASFGAMTGEELLNCQRTAVRAAFCAEETKAALLAALADFEARL